MMGSGGMIVMDEDNCMVDIARFFLDFTVDESCGKCTPCRIGTRRMLEILNRICDGKGEDGDIERLENLAQNIKATALCGLGQTAPNPVLSTIKQFRHEYEAHIYDKHCPAGVCKKLLNYVIDPEKCRGCTLCARVCPTGSISARSRSRIDRSQEVHQVRRLYGEVQVWRHLQEVSKEVAIDEYDYPDHRRRVGSVPAGSTVLEAAKAAGIHIPTLCYMKGLNEIGACRLCVVDTARAPCRPPACCPLPRG